VHAQLSRDPLFPSGGVVVVNRGLVDAPGPFQATATAFRLVPSFQELPQSPPFAAAVGAVPASSAVRLAAALSWPAGARAGETLLWRVDLTGAGGALVSRSEYLLSSLETNISASGAPSLREASDARYAQPLLSLAAAAAGAVSDDGLSLRVSVNVTLPASAPRAAIAVRVSLRNPAAAVTAATGFVDDRVLPQLPDGGYFSLLPGETRAVAIDCGAQGGLDSLHVVVDGWNTQETNSTVVMVSGAVGR